MASRRRLASFSNSCSGRSAAASSPSTSASPRGKAMVISSLTSNKVQELRGTLAEITMALPRGEAEVLGELAAAERPEQELEKDAKRRREAMLAWQENHESGARYAGLRGYLSESQQDEIDDSIRLTLTARQLQVN